MKYLYLLTVTNEETGEEVGHIEAFSEESLLEQLRKIDSIIKKYEEEKRTEDELDEYNKTHSSCCDALITSDRARCSECKEGV